MLLPDDPIYPALVLFYNPYYGSVVNVYAKYFQDSTFLDILDKGYKLI
jgi:hypothetical protein